MTAFAGRRPHTGPTEFLKKRRLLSDRNARAIVSHLDPAETVA